LLRTVAEDGYTCDLDGRRFKTSGSLRTHRSKFHRRNNAVPVQGDSGETAASVFELFEQGATPAGVVIKLRLSPDTVGELFAQYDRLINDSSEFYRRIYDEGLAYGKEKGMNEGFASARKQFELTFWCSVCRKAMSCRPNSEMHRFLVQAAFDKGWGHAECSERQRQGQ